MSKNENIEQDVNANSESPESVATMEAGVDDTLPELLSSDEDQIKVLKAELEEVKAALAKAEEKAEENYNLALREKAEAENGKRRMENEISKAHKFGIEKLVNELLPIVDSMELGLAAVGDDNATVEKFREGSELTMRMFLNALDKFAIEAVDPKGEKFNPELHQAMSMQENNEVAPNTVLAVMQKGYTLQGRLLRPAMVIVSKAAVPPKESQIDEMA